MKDSSITTFSNTKLKLIMLNAIEIHSGKKRVHTLAKHHVKGSSDVFLPTKLNSEKESTQLFSKEHDADNNFSDIRLPDGFSFDIFVKTNIRFPVIFITSNNVLMMTTIGINNNNYLSEIEDKKDFEKKILQPDNLETLLLNNTGISGQAGSFFKFEKREKTRLLVKRGVTNIALLLNDIAAIYTKNKLVYVIDRDSKKYSIDNTLSELEVRLDKNIFFRANRQYIININFVKSFKAYKKVKLLVDINIPELEYPIIISQHVASVFKNWMEDA